MSTQRRHPRARIRQRLWCESATSTLYVRATNASEGGLFIRSPCDSCPGDQVRIHFRVPGGEVDATCEVVWRRPSGQRKEAGIGVRLVRFVEGEELYRSFVRRQLASGTSPGILQGLGPFWDEPAHRS